MAREIQLDAGRSGLTLYALIIDAGGQIWNGAELELPDASHWATYPVAMPEQSTTGIYMANMPAAPNGFYSISVRRQNGGSPASTDPVYGAGTVAWDGTALVFPIPGPATAPELCRVYGFEYLNGQPVLGRSISAKLVVLPSSTGDVSLEGSDAETTTDADGYWHLDLVRGLSYAFRILEAGVSRTLVVPDSDTAKLIDLLAA
jgi:hypothetical protein